MDHFLRTLTCALAATLGLTLARGEAAEKKDTRPVLDPPPPVMPQNVSVLRGRKVEIPLKIYGVQNEPLRYMIKAAPAHGRLSEPRMVSREAAVVTYEPPPDLAVTADRFSFSVQNHAGVSAPAEVTISIVDPPPQLAVPNTVEFGELLAGRTAMREIEIANRGGGMIQGEIEVDPPFQIEGRRNYRLEAGDYTYFKIVFAPSEGGLFRREVRYTSTREFVTSLVGSAQTPISAEPARIELRHAADSAVRTGAFEIVNRTDEPLTFQIKGSSRLQLPESVQVAAQARAAIAVSTRAEVVGDLDEEVRVESPGFSLSVPVRAARVGPILRVAQRSLALGRVDAARGAQASVELQNAGGTAAKVTGEIAAPFSLSESTFDLAPGATKRLTLNVKPSEPQRYRTWLKFKAGTASAEVEVDAELIGDMTSERAAGERAAKTKKAARPEDLPPWMPDPGIARAIRVNGVTSTSARIEWPAELNSADHFRLERMMLTRDSAREIRTAWVEIPRATIARQGPIWTASLSGLQPQQSQTVRVVPLNAEGRPERELFRLDFYTASSRIIPKPRLVPMLLATLAIALGYLFWKRLRRHFSAPLSGF